MLDAVTAGGSGPKGILRTVADQDVEIVRRYFELVDRMLDEYWGDPVPLREFPALDLAFEQLHPEAEWTPPHLERPLCGREAWLEGIEDLFDAVDYWRIHIDVVTSLDDGIVLIASRNQIRGKGSGVDVEQGIFTVVTLEGGKIATIRDFPERDQALTAARAAEA